MQIETEYIDFVIVENTEEEKKLAKLFYEGKIWLYWDKEKKKAIIYPNIFKVKEFDVMIILKKSPEEFSRAFLNLWKIGKIRIKYDKKINDFITSESVLNERFHR
jgi:hypothetical protein